MAVIYSYPVKTDPHSDDLILISDSQDDNKTKQVAISDVRGATTAGVSSIIAGTSNVTLDPAAGTGDVTISVTDSGSSAAIIETVKNNSLTDDIIKGQPLHIVGVSGTTPTVEVADASDPAKMPVSGLANENISANQTGEMIVSGILEGIDTNGLDGSPDEAAVVYVSTSTGGSIDYLVAASDPTDIPATEANLIQNVGIIVKDSPGTSGSIQVTAIGRTNATPNLNQGSIFIGDINGRSSSLAIGANNYVLTSNGTTATWAPASGGYTLPLATSSVRGGVKIGYVQNAKNYPVQLLNEQMFVNVPWTDTATSPAGSDTQIQFNSSGSFGASANLIFGNNTLSVQDTAIIKGDGATNPGKLRINCRTNSHYVELAGPEHTGMVASYELALPNTAPTSNQILQASGSGVLSWINTPSDTNTNIANTNLTLDANRTTSLDDYNLNITSDNVSIGATGGIVRFQNYDSTSTSSPTAVRVDKNAQVDGQAYVTLHSKGTVTGNVSIDWNDGNVQEMTLTGNVNLTQANCKPGGTYILIVNQEADTYSITWSTDFDWMNNNTPPGTITSNRADVYSFVCRTTTSLLGTYAEDFIV